MLKYDSVSVSVPSQIPFTEHINKWLERHPGIKVVTSNTLSLNVPGVTSTTRLVWTVLYEEDEPEVEDSQETHDI